MIDKHSVEGRRHDRAAERAGRGRAPLRHRHHRRSGRITDWLEKPKKSSATLASMGFYVFKTDVLIERLLADASGRLRSTTSAATSSRR